MNWNEVLPAGGRNVLLAWFDLDAEDAVFETLSREERARAKRFRCERDARRFAAGRTAVRRALGGLLGIAPRDVAIAAGAHGRPELAHRGVPRPFSFAHAGAKAVLAVVEAGSVGVDVEARDAAPDADELAPMTMPAAELREFRELPASKRREEFLRRFTAREAVLKAAGTGFCCDPRSISLRPEGGALRASGDSRVEGLFAWPLKVDAGFVASLATDRKDEGRAGARPAPTEPPGIFRGATPGAIGAGFSRS